MHEIVEATLDDLELGSAEVVLPKWFCRRGSAELGSAGVVLPAWFCRNGSAGVVLPTCSADVVLPIRQYQPAATTAPVTADRVAKPAARAALSCCVFDALRVKIRDESTVRIQAVSLALAVLPDGSRDIMGILIEQTEGAKFLDEGLTAGRASFRFSRFPPRFDGSSTRPTPSRACTRSFARSSRRADIFRTTTRPRN
jgi:hypothetical protein